MRIRGGLIVEQSPRLRVRRLTPTEYERLQGLPTGYTDIPWRSSSSRHRYKIVARLPDHLEVAENELTTLSRELFLEILQELQEIVRIPITVLYHWCWRNQQRIKALDLRLALISQQLRRESIPVSGHWALLPLTIALGRSAVFQNGRHFASYLGRVLKEYSSGGKVKLLGITKRGDGYLRGWLIHSARSVAYRVINLP